jgi:two-component system chemotaxis sensor kinase CheA
MSDSETVVRDEFFDSVLGDFLDESGQLLDRLNENLLQLDDWVRSLDEDHHQRCDDDLMNEMFRSAHSLKGLSAMLGLGEINNLTHKVENVFDAARKDELTLTGDCVELMFQAVDRLVGLVDALKDPTAEPVECDAVLADIGRVLQSAGVERAQSSQEDAEKALGDIAAELAEATPQSGPLETEAASAPLETTTAAPQSQAIRTRPAIHGAPPAPLVDHFDGLVDEAEISLKYLSIFIDEAELSLDSLTETLLALEGGGSLAELENLLVTSHRIKGSAASIGLNRAAKLAHLMEDLLQNLVDTGETPSAHVTDAMLTCTDALRLYLDALKKGEAHSDHFSDLARELLAAQKAKQPDPAAISQAEPAATAVESQPPVASSLRDTPAGVPDAIRKLVAQSVPSGAEGFVGEVVFRRQLPLVGLKARLVFEKLSNLGEVCYFDPPAEEIDEIEELDKVAFGVVTDKPLELILGRLRIAGVDKVIAESIDFDAPSPPAGKPASPAVVRPVSVSRPPAAVPVAADTAAGGSTASTPATRPPVANTAVTQAASAPIPAKSRPPESGNKPTETLRVDIDRLDQLMNLAGQLVINKARFSQIGDNLKSLVGNKQSAATLDKVFSVLGKMANGRNDESRLQAELALLRSQARRVQNDLETIRRELQCLAQVRGSVNDLAEAVHQLDRVSDGIQQSVMDTRMVPIGPLFARFKRVVRDITRANGKSIRLVINGEKTELDKRMIDELGDPLIHMVRNSADHGIELPDRREAAGKPREGTVTLDAFHRGNSIYIEVTDDGKGLDLVGILEKALERGVVSEADAEKMTPHQIYQLIWEPGLSTAEKVTEVSGRGMGMDIVKSKIEDLNGTVDLDSTPGKGTRLTIKLPLTLAILPSLMVKIEDDIFAMPMESIVEIVGVTRNDMSTVHGRRTARVRGRVISTVDLGELFTWNRQGTSGGRQNDGELTLVIVGDEGRELGLAVDHVIGEEDVVIKSMAENYRNVTGIAGASILGDGRVSLILDINALLAMASNQSSAYAVS